MCVTYTIICQIYVHSIYNVCNVRTYISHIIIVDYKIYVKDNVITYIMYILKTLFSSDH